MSTRAKRSCRGGSAFAAQLAAGSFLVFCLFRAFLSHLLPVNFQRFLKVLRNKKSHTAKRDQ
jgi:hypothetical protein